MPRLLFHMAKRVKKMTSERPGRQSTFHICSDFDCPKILPYDGQDRCSSSVGAVPFLHHNLLHKIPRDPVLLGHFGGGFAPRSLCHGIRPRSLRGIFRISIKGKPPYFRESADGTTLGHDRLVRNFGAKIKVDGRPGPTAGNGKSPFSSIRHAGRGLNVRSRMSDMDPAIDPGIWVDGRSLSPCRGPS